MRIGRKLCDRQGCKQVHFLYPDLKPAHALRDGNDPWEDGYEIFIPDSQEREATCTRCGANVVVPPKIVLSLAVNEYEDWILETVSNED